MNHAEINFAKKVSLETWHHHFGYANEQNLKKIVKEFQLSIANKECMSCLNGKCMHYRINQGKIKEQLNLLD